MSERVLVFGASGYIGRHLTARLAASGMPVRAVARRLAPLEAEGWAAPEARAAVARAPVARSPESRSPESRPPESGSPESPATAEGKADVEIMAADALDPASLPAALDGIDVAYYLVHSMMAGGDFPARDRLAARHFAEAAAAAGVRRIVYLGGLAPPGRDTVHLASRIETGAILRQGAVPVTELRAGIIVGPGSAAFEVMRDLVAHLPVMVTPRWIYSRSPPLALDELLDYLVALPGVEAAAGRVLEAGGPDCYTYEAMMLELAQRLGRRRPWIIPVPLLTPRLSSYWLALVTATPVTVASALITGLEHDLVADDRPLRELVPDVPRVGFAAALDRVFAAEQRIRATDRWREGAFELRGFRHDVSFYGKTMAARGSARVPPDRVWQVLERIGEPVTGYFFLDAVWRVRSWLDRALGAVDAGRRRPGGKLEAGTRFDFWRVLAATPGRRLTLVSSLMAPGAGGMEFTLQPTSGGDYGGGDHGGGDHGGSGDDARASDGRGNAGEGATLEAAIHWHPAGFWGLLYWYALWPAHALVLRGMVRAICIAAETAAANTEAANTAAADRETRHVGHEQAGDRREPERP